MTARMGKKLRPVLIVLLLLLVSAFAFAQHDWGEIVKSSQRVPMNENGGVAEGDVATGFSSFALDVDRPGPLTLETIVTEVRPGTEYEDDDSMLWLFDAEGYLIAENDDTPMGGYTSLINGFQIDNPGRYYVVVTTHPNQPVTDWDSLFTNLGDEGASNISFQLVVEYGSRPGPLYGEQIHEEPAWGNTETAIWFDDFRSLAEPIHYSGGELVVDGRVGPGVALYHLTLDEPTALSAEVLVTGDLSQNGTGDSVMFLFDTDGYQVAEDDDGGVDGGSMINEVYLDQPDGYYLAVVSYPNYPNTDSFGYVEGFPEIGEGELEYQLIIGPPREPNYPGDISTDHPADVYPDYGFPANSIGEIADAAEYIPITNGRGIGSGEVGTGFAAFAIEIDEPLYVTIEVLVTEVRQGVTYADSDSVLTLFGSDGALYARDDDGGTDGASKMESVWLPDPGTYYAIVTTYPNEPATDGGYFDYVDTSGESAFAFDLVVRTDIAAQ